MRLQRFLGLWAAIALTAALTVLLNSVLDLGRAEDQIVGGPPAATDPEGPGATTEDATPLGPGQVRVRGRVDALHLDGALLDPRSVPTPLTIVSERGFGNGGELTGVLVDGRTSTAVWDGGRPFVLSSPGALVLDPLSVDLVDDGLRLVLGGAAHVLTPGRYQLDTPVAVGSAGIATPRDTLAFEAVDGSLFEAHGDASLLLAPTEPRRFVGPGVVVLLGDLTLVDADGERAATELRTGAVAFELTFTPDAAGAWTVEGLIDQSGAP